MKTTGCSHKGYLNLKVRCLQYQVGAQLDVYQYFTERKLQTDGVTSTTFQENILFVTLKRKHKPAHA